LRQPDVIKNANEACFSAPAATTTGAVTETRATVDSSGSLAREASTADSSRHTTEGVVRWNSSRVAKIHQRVADIGTDFLQKLSTALIHENQVIVVETLDTKNMLQNRRLAGVISDAGFGHFIGMLEYKCKWYGRTLVKR
jgi:IS605 OrfB family transposase